MNVEEKNLKHFAYTSHSVFEGLKGGHFEHTKTLSAKCFFLNLFSTFINNAYYTNSRFFSSKKYAHKK